MEIKFDSYLRKARLLPALLVVLPISIAVLSVNPNGISGWSVIWSLIIFSGGTLLISELGRDMGKKKEDALYTLWGGKPSIKLLRHNDSPNLTLLAIRHRKLEKLIQNLSMPSLEQEKKDYKKADEVYEICSTYLRNNTRDTKKFPLVYKELCSYGFRRNLWGMKPIGIFFNIVGFVLLSLSIYRSATQAEPIVFISLGVLLCFLMLWLFWINKNWVKITAFAYAERLLESVDNL